MLVVIYILYPPVAYSIVNNWQTGSQKHLMIGNEIPFSLTEEVCFWVQQLLWMAQVPGLDEKQLPILLDGLVFKLICNDTSVLVAFQLFVRQVNNLFFVPSTSKR